jgi:hypothetical protein
MNSTWAWLSLQCAEDNYLSRDQLQAMMSLIAGSWLIAAEQKPSNWKEMRQLPAAPNTSLLWHHYLSHGASVSGNCASGQWAWNQRLSWQQLL